ncbi:MAG: enoyl-CoA hydratase/isomerase family protein [Oligoflexia bacterium]|nr:enoyl-CoA hydratase/isomerase family protein [Oligoflexia bacterium]
MNNYETIVVEQFTSAGVIYDSVIMVRLHRPQVHNAINQQMILELNDLLDYLSAGEGSPPSVNCLPRILLLTGNQKSPTFCAGADLKEMQNSGVQNQQHDALQHDAIQNDALKNAHNLAELYSKIFNFPRPVIVLANGNAFGGGVGLLAVADYVLAQQDCKFAFPEVRKGLIPAVISPYLWNKCAGNNYSLLKYHILSGTSFGTQLAKELGLVQDIFVDEDMAVAKIVKIVEDLLPAQDYAQADAKRWCNRFLEGAVRAVPTQQECAKKLAAMVLDSKTQKLLNGYDR